MPSILITGANRGIGLEFARQYAADSWRVFAACRRPGEAAALNRLAEAASGRVTVHGLDVTQPGAVAALAAELGIEAIDVLINNAGIAGPGGNGDGTDFDGWTETLAVTLGPVRVAEAFADHVARSGAKTMVALTSGMGSIADNTSGGYLAYRTSKGDYKEGLTHLPSAGRKGGWEKHRSRSPFGSSSGT